MKVSTLFPDPLHTHFLFLWNFPLPLYFLSFYICILFNYKINSPIEGFNKDVVQGLEDIGYNISSSDSYLSVVTSVSYLSGEAEASGMIIIHLSHSTLLSISLFFSLSLSLSLSLSIFLFLSLSLSVSVSLFL